jgi:hypothetical protein
VGKDADDMSKNESRLVAEGFKGIRRKSLLPGKYAINTRVQSVAIVPTNAIVLEWSDDLKPSDNYDVNLKTLTLRTEESFSFKVAVTQVIGINAEDAPKMILKVGSRISEAINDDSNSSSKRMKNNAIRSLVVKILGPMIDNYFQNSAQDFKALDFLARRSEIQAAAAEHIKAALNDNGVQALGTFINIIDFPAELEEQLKQRTISEQERQTLEVEEITEQLRQNLIREKEITKSQVDRIKAERDLEIAKLNAQASLENAGAEAAAKRLMDDVVLKTEEERLRMTAQHEERLRNIEINELREKILALSPELYAKIESEKAWSQALAQTKIKMPQILIGGNNGSSPGTNDLQAGTMQLAWIDMLRDMYRQREPKQINTPNVEVLNPASDSD